MNATEILENNYTVQNDSFTFILRENGRFEKEALRQLCESIYQLAETNVNISRTAAQINTVYGMVLKLFLYHFDPDDSFHITNLPENYNRMIEQLEKSVSFYFNTRI